MSQNIYLRDFIKKSLLTPAAGALAMHAAQNRALAQGAAKKSGPAHSYFDLLRLLKVRRQDFDSRMINAAPAIKLKAMVKKIAVFIKDIIIHL